VVIFIGLSCHEKTQRNYPKKRKKTAIIRAITIVKDSSIDDFKSGTSCATPFNCFSRLIYYLTSKCAWFHIQNFLSLKKKWKEFFFKSLISANFYWKKRQYHPHHFMTSSLTIISPLKTNRRRTGVEKDNIKARGYQRLSIGIYCLNYTSQNIIYEIYCRVHSYYILYI
jgi:hypothetical protein